ncbi:MAG: hypothetical protein WCT35_08915 [Sideroxydans sp.]
MKQFKGDGEKPPDWVAFLFTRMFEWSAWINTSIIKKLMVIHSKDEQVEKALRRLCGFGSGRDVTGQKKTRAGIFRGVVAGVAGVGGEAFDRSS